MHRRKRIFRFLIVTLLAVFPLTFLYAEKAKDKPAKLVKILIGEGMQPPAAPIYVAKFKGFWEEEGLDVELQPFTAGRLVLDAVLGGRVNAGYMAETPPMLAALRKQPIRLIAAFESSNENAKALVRRDMGISTPSDLIDKKVACTIGTNGEYFMSVFLRENGIDRKLLKVINLSPADMVTAVTKGEVVAIFTWEPHIANAKRILGDKGEIWFGREIYREAFFMGTTEDYIKKNPEVIKAILRGLIKAEKFIKENPNETIKFTSPRVNMSEELLKSIWDYFEFRIYLDQVHLETLIDEGKWAIEAGIASEGTALPDFRTIIHPGPLREIDPSRVTLRD